MAHHLAGIDHVLLPMPDSEAALRMYRRLGFLPTSLIDADDGVPVSHAFLFRRGYVAFAAGLGLDGEVGLACRDIDAARRSLGAVGVVVPEATAHRRFIALSAERRDFSSFDAVLPTGCLPGLHATLCRRPADDGIGISDETIAHPNGVVGIVSLTVVVDDPEALTPRYNQVFGPAASTPTDDMITVHTGHGLIYLVSVDRFDDLHPSLDLSLPTVPQVMVLTLGVTDLSRTSRLLADNGVDVAHRGDHLGVRLTGCGPVGLEFVEV